MKPVGYAYYILIDVKSSEIYLSTSEPGEPMRIRDHGEAVKLGVRLNDEAILAAQKAGKKKPFAIWQVHGPFTDDKMNWRKREQARFTDGFYKRLHPELEQLTQPDHFAHQALNDPKALAYTPGAGEGVRDVQKRIAVATYLERFQPDLPPPTVQRLVQQHMEHVSLSALEWATTPDEIIRAYTTFDANFGGGPSTSCMRYPGGHFRGHMHPVGVYGDSDLCLAIIRSEKGVTLARSVVRKDLKIYSRVYGVEADDAGVRLMRLLEQAGYQKSRGYYGGGGYANVSKEHSLVGARIRAIKDTRNGRQAEYIMPYVDECGWGELTEDKKFFTLRRERPARRAISVQSTSGVAEYLGFSCPVCGGRCSDDTPMTELAIDVRPDGTFGVLEACPSCTTNHSFVCAGLKRRFSKRHMSMYRIDGETYSGYWTERHFKCCHSCGQWTSGKLYPLLRRHRRQRTDDVCDHCLHMYGCWDASLGMFVREEMMIPASVTVGHDHIVSDTARVRTGVSWLSPEALTYDGGKYAGAARAIQEEHADSMGGAVMCMIVDAAGVARCEPDIGTVFSYSEAIAAIKDCRWNEGWRVEKFDEHAGPARVAVGSYVEVADVPQDPEGARRGVARGVVVSDHQVLRPYTVKLDNGCVMHVPFTGLRKVEGAPPKEYPPKRLLQPGDEVYVGDRASGRYGAPGVVIRVDKSGQADVDQYSVHCQLTTGGRTVFHRSLCLIRPVEEAQAENRAKGFITTPSFSNKDRGRRVQPNASAASYGLNKKYIGVDGAIVQIMSSSEALIRMSDGTEYYLMPRHVNMMLTPEEMGQTVLPIDEVKAKGKGKAVESLTEFKEGQRVRILPGALGWNATVDAIGKIGVVQSFYTLSPSAWSDDDEDEEDPITEDDDGSEVREAGDKPNVATVYVADATRKYCDVRLSDVELVSEPPRFVPGDLGRLNASCVRISIPDHYVGETVEIREANPDSGSLRIQTSDGAIWGARVQHIDPAPTTKKHRTI